MKNMMHMMTAFMILYETYAKELEDESGMRSVFIPK